MRRILKDSLQSDYSILFLCPFLRKKDVVTTISREFASKAVYRKDLTGLIDSIWTKTLQEKPYLFNQSKFRLFDATMNGVCRLRLGLTDYKSYVGSNLGPQWKLFYDEGMKVGDPNAFFGNPLGNLTVVVLNDGNHVLLNRSYQVAEGQGKFACVGGHPEPTQIGISSYDDAEKISSEVVTGELFDSMRREVHEETNIPLSLLSDMFMIGMISCNATHGRQVQMFCCFADLNTEQARNYYRMGPEDQYESVGINFFSLDTIVSMINTKPESFCPETRSIYAILTQLEEPYQKVMKDSLSKV